MPKTQEKTKATMKHSSLKKNKSIMLQSPWELLDPVEERSTKAYKVEVTFQFFFFLLICFFLHRDSCMQDLLAWRSCEAAMFCSLRATFSTKVSWVSPCCWCGLHCLHRCIYIMPDVDQRSGLLLLCAAEHLRDSYWSVECSCPPFTQWLWWQLPSDRLGRDTEMYELHD